MRILILDDDDERHRTFARHFTGHDVKHVRTAQDCVKALKYDEAYDLVHLDHDLNDFEYESKMPGMYGDVEMTGTDVSRYIADKLSLEKRPARIVVHSWNAYGGPRMRDILQNAGISTTYEPFVPDPFLPEEDFGGPKGG